MVRNNLRDIGQSEGGILDPIFVCLLTVGRLAHHTHN